MRNIVGQPVSGIDYFPRIGITNLIFRRLDSGSHVFMSAPRRVGKTSIMYQLRDLPKDGYIFIYVNTESVDDSELYFKRLFDALLNSDAISNRIKHSEQSKKIFEWITERVKKVGAFGLELELEHKDKGTYADIFLDLMQKLQGADTRIVVMIDEFPSTIENINQKHGLSEAVRFLKQNRVMRQESGGGIQFIYTGSIGLPAIVNRLNTPESINDLNVVEIPPLSRESGYTLTQQLLETAKVPYKPEAISYLLDRINWLMPFFIQLSVQELIDVYDQREIVISKTIVDEAFQRICNRRNNIHFDSYYNRLKDAFLAEDYELALEVLNTIARNNSISQEEFIQSWASNPDTERNLRSIIESLVYDGYIHLESGAYTFNSPILQLWWNRYNT